MRTTFPRFHITQCVWYAMGVCVCSCTYMCERMNVTFVLINRPINSTLLFFNDFCCCCCCVFAIGSEYYNIFSEYEFYVSHITSHQTNCIAINYRFHNHSHSIVDLFFFVLLLSVFLFVKKENGNGKEKREWKKTLNNNKSQWWCGNTSSWPHNWPSLYGWARKKMEHFFPLFKSPLHKLKRNHFPRSRLIVELTTFFRIKIKIRYSSENCCSLITKIKNKHIIIIFTCSIFIFILYININIKQYSYAM